MIQVANEICSELAPVGIVRVVKHLNTETVRKDPDAIQDLRDIESNEAKRVACLKGAKK